MECIYVPIDKKPMCNVYGKWVYPKEDVTR